MPAYQRRPATLHDVQGSNPPIRFGLPMHAQLLRLFVTHPPIRALNMQLAKIPHTHHTTPRATSAPGADQPARHPPRAQQVPAQRCPATATPGAAGEERLKRLKRINGSNGALSAEDIGTLSPRPWPDILAPLTYHCPWLRQLRARRCSACDKVRMPMYMVHSYPTLQVGAASATHTNWNTIFCCMCSNMSV